MPSAPPKVVSAEVVATQPTDADTPMIASLSRELNRRLPAAVFIVKVRLEKLLEPTGDGWALYLGSMRIPKYWEYPGGIYFKVFDQTFLVDHQGEALRFSRNDQEFVDTGVKLPGPGEAQAATKAAARALPLQSKVLGERGAARPAGARAARKPSVRATGSRRSARTRKTRKS
jgi:hypothetical protein